LWLWRQDRGAAFGEPISARVVANMLVRAGINHIITFDLHSDQIEGFFSVPVDNLKCYSLFADYFKKKKLPNPVIVAPDAGAAKIARRLADLIECPMAILHKRRPGHHKIEHTHLVGDIKNKTVILFDDMIDTAGSICAAKDKAIKQGARKNIYAAATHGIFSGPAFDRLKSANFKEIVITDTVPTKGGPKNLRVLSVVGLLKDVL
jgi:ribose-phosphate pyrophosphokinase